MNDEVVELLKNNSGIRLDIGCGENKQQGFVGMDYRALPGVDIVCDVMKFPWPLPDESVSLATASHLLEHISPDNGDARVFNLINLLEKKGVITTEEITEHIGERDPGPRFMRFMDEVWRVMKPDGQFACVFPYAGSPGYWQDPTHVNGITENTLLYFDPLEPRAGGQLYRIYKPKPWEIRQSAYAKGGNMEIVLVKRRVDESYYK